MRVQIPPPAPIRLRAPGSWLRASGSRSRLSAPALRSWRQATRSTSRLPEVRSLQPEADFGAHQKLVSRLNSSKRALTSAAVALLIRLVLTPCTQNDASTEPYTTARRRLALETSPLRAMKPISATDEQTKQATEDRRYWVEMGYEF